MTSRELLGKLKTNTVLRVVVVALLLKALGREDSPEEKLLHQLGVGGQAGRRADWQTSTQNSQGDREKERGNKGNSQFIGGIFRQDLSA